MTLPEEIDAVILDHFTSPEVGEPDIEVVQAARAGIIAAVEKRLPNRKSRTVDRTAEGYAYIDGFNRCRYEFIKRLRGSE